MLSQTNIKEGLKVQGKSLTPNPKLYGADKLECEMFAAGYVRSPNNIHALPSVHWMDDDKLRGISPIWYAGTCDMPIPPSYWEIQVCPDRIRVFSTKFFGEPYSKASFYDTVTEAVFENVPAFIEWCKEHGELSQPGLPAFSNSWD